MLLSTLAWHWSVALLYLGAPFDAQSWAELYAIVPAIGLAGLVIGAVLGTRQGASGLWWFALPILLVHVFMLLAGDLGLIATPWANALLVALLIANLASLFWAWRRSRSAPWPAAALTVFCLTYVPLATFWVFIRYFNGPPNPPPLLS